MMYRKIMQYLKNWKNSPWRKPLILQGARQVGKTYSLLEFGRLHYDNVAYFNFETTPQLNKAFEEDIRPDYLIPLLSSLCGVDIVREKTLIIFDETQLCERALTSLKFKGICRHSLHDSLIINILDRLIKPVTGRYIFVHVCRCRCRQNRYHYQHYQCRYDHSIYFFKLHEISFSQ